MRKNQNKFFMFQDSFESEEKNIESAVNMRTAEILRNIYLEKWKKNELLNLISLYYQYFNEHKNEDCIYDINEYIVSGQYAKDRSENHES